MHPFFVAAALGLHQTEVCEMEHKGKIIIIALGIASLSLGGMWMGDHWNDVSPHILVRAGEEQKIL